MCLCEGIFVLNTCLKGVLMLWIVNLIEEAALSESKVADKRERKVIIHSIHMVCILIIRIVYTFAILKCIF